MSVHNWWKQPSAHIRATDTTTGSLSYCWEDMGETATQFSPQKQNKGAPNLPTSFWGKMDLVTGSAKGLGLRRRRHLNYILIAM